jgi:hypothetical protein
METDQHDVLSKELNVYIEKYLVRIEEELMKRWNSWEKDITISEQYEVIGAIMARQVSIVINFANNSSIWNGHIAPLIMRSLIDNYINFAWILIDPLERSRQFIYYGLGQEKLMLEHYKKQFEGEAVPDDIQAVIDSIESWINSQRYSFLTDVSFKSWSDRNIRQMAEEIGCQDLYIFPYQQFSSVVHNMWNHVGRYNSRQSENPMHKFMRMPGILKDPPDMYYLDLAVKYISKMFDGFDRKFGQVCSKDLYTDFHEGLDSIFQKFNRR